MPEGHTLHRLARVLDAAYAHTSPSVTSPQGPFTDGAALLDGQPVRHADAHGKHLFVEFAGDRWLNVHLGLIGKLTVTHLPQVDGYASVPPPRGAVRMRMVNDAYLADLRGAIVCAVVTPEEVAATTARLGPDPLRPDQDVERAWTRLSRSRRSIAELLMDQSVLAGVGNVYRCEVLYRHRVDPFRPGREIRRTTWDTIWADLVRLLPIGVAFNRIVTMPDQVERAEAMIAAGRVPELRSTWTDAVGPRGFSVGDEPNGDEDEDATEGTTDVVLPTARPPRLRRSYYVYRRQGEPCRVCGSRIRTKVVTGRNLFWCGRCQRRR